MPGERREERVVAHGPGPGEAVGLAEQVEAAEKPQAAPEKTLEKPKKGKHGASRKNPDHTGSIDSADDANPFPDTLTQDDLAITLDVPQPLWDGPQP